jgi:hypothetical protein
MDFRVISVIPDVKVKAKWLIYRTFFMNTIYSIPIRKRCENPNSRHSNDVTFDSFLIPEIFFWNVSLFPVFNPLPLQTWSH